MPRAWRHESICKLLGKRGVGGLLATRRLQLECDASQEVIRFDTAAQLFSASHPRFHPFVYLGPRKCTLHIVIGCHSSGGVPL